MTYKEKYIIEHPEHRDNMNAIMNTSCPDSWDNPENPYCGPERIKNNCIACWNRELTENELNKFNKEREKMCECNDKRELLDMIKDYEDRLKYANAEIDNLDGKIAGYKYEVKELIAKLDDANKCALDVMNELAEFKKEYEILDEESDRQDKEIEELRNKLAEHAQQIENQRILIKGKDEVIENYQKMQNSIEDLGCTITSDFVVVPPIAHITHAELELMDLKGRYEALSSSYNSKKKALDTQNEEIDSLHDKVKLRDEEIDKLVKENEGLRVDMQRRDDTITGLCARLNEHDDLINAIAEKNKEIMNLRKEIENKQNHINELCARIDKMCEAEYIKFDIDLTKYVNERLLKELKNGVRSVRLIGVPKEEPTIRPIDELPYVRYANHIHMKYKALTDNGFSHDDAMGLIPMWDDNEFEGFKHRERDE